MTKALGLVQPGWGNPNHGRHTASLGDLFERCWGPRAPSAGKTADQGKGTGASPTRGGAARPKAVVDVVVQGRVPGGGGPVLHGDSSGGGMG
jgi:hypothetical protein